jgi:hypothetical protein
MIIEVMRQHSMAVTEIEEQDEMKNWESDYLSIDEKGELEMLRIEVNKLRKAVREQQRVIKALLNKGE